MRIIKNAVQLTVANEGTTVTSSALPINGLLRGITVSAPDLTGSNTYTITLLDENDGTVSTFATLTENSVTTKYIDANNNYFNQPLHNPRARIISSGTETGAKVFTVYLYYES